MFEAAIELANQPAVWVSLITLIIMEVVLGIDNLIFISLVTNQLPPEQGAKARRIGISMALILRLGLLSIIAWIIQLTEPVFSLLEHTFSWRDLILIGGGLFLVWKATTEISDHVDQHDRSENTKARVAASFGAVIVQILVLDMIFSLDSIITAVGMTPHLIVMVIAVVVAVSVMLLAADPLANFINRNPSVVMLALGFLLLIGTTLIAEGFGVHIPKGYIYVAMAFSALVETLNLLSRRKKKSG